VNLGIGQGALHALPAPADDDPLIATIRSLLPERSAEDRAHGEVPVTFGQGQAAEAIRIPVLPQRANRAWQEKVRDAGKQLVDQIATDTTGQVMIGLLTGATDLQLDLLAAYNPELLSRDFLETHATEEQILDAFLGVTAAAYPFPVKLARTLLANREVARWARLQLVRLLYSSSTSSSPPSTTSRSRRSKTN